MLAAIEASSGRLSTIFGADGAGATGVVGVVGVDGGVVDPLLPDEPPPQPFTTAAKTMARTMRAEVRIMGAFT